jgi:tRNA modification GTPase
VEGLADLVAAETQGQRRQAFRQMKGLLGNRAESWRQRLIQALALVEARIDFFDEADVPKDLAAPALVLARELEGEIAAALADSRSGERLRDGLVVAIAGPPNAGKSTLLNLLARREAAIVSPYAGTTRDVIEVHLDLGGLPVTLLDTAGIRDTDDPVEMEGVRRARERAAGADLVLWVMDATHAVIPGREPTSPPVIPGRAEGGGPESRAPGVRARRFAASRNDDVVADEPGPPTWLIRNKIDLFAGGPQRNESKSASILSNEPGLRTNETLTNMVNAGLTSRSEPETAKSDLEFSLSATTGEGFDRLLAALGSHAENFLAGAESALVTRARHRRALEDTQAALRRALGSEIAGREDLLAEELRIATRALGRLTGRVDVEDILDVIFRDFCIGK